MIKHLCFPFPNDSGTTYLLLLAFCKAPPLSEHKQQFCKKRTRELSGERRAKPLVAVVWSYSSWKRVCMFMWVKLSHLQYVIYGF